jgi:hypothetical protein
MNWGVKPAWTEHSSSPPPVPVGLLWAALYAEDGIGGNSDVDSAAAAAAEEEPAPVGPMPGVKA